MKKRALLIVLCGAMVGAFFVPWFAAKAASLTITFDDGGYAYTIINGTLVDEMPGHGITLKRAAGPPSTYASVRIDLPGISTVTHVCLDSYKNSGPPYNLGRAIWLYDASDNRLSYTFGNPSTYFFLYENYSAYEWTKPCADVNVPGVSYAIAQIGSGGSYSAHLDNISITYSSDSPTITPSVSPTPTATYHPVASWNKPIRGSDQKTDDLIYYPANAPGSALTGNAYTDTYNLNVGFSAAPGLYVFAVFAGSITAVDPFTCSPVFGPESICEILWSGMPVSRYGIQTQGAYLVSEALADGRTIRYLISNPLIETGDTVTGGCLIGTVPKFYDYFGNTLGEGALLIQGLETDGVTAFDLSPMLITEPSGVACKSNTNSSCALVQNSTFQATGGGWQLNPGRPETYIPYLIPNGGVFFPVSIAQTLNLDSAAQYRIELLYEVQANSPAQKLSVGLGTTETVMNLDSTQDKTTYIIPADTYTADQPGGLYSFRIEGLEDAERLTLYFACVSDANDSVVVPGGGCIVLDPNFGQSYIDSPWTVSGAPDPPAVIPGGMAIIPDGGFVSQSITLWPGDGGINVNYDLLVTYRRQGIANAGKDIKLSWAFGGSSGDLEPASTSQTWADYTATFGVATNVVTDDLILTGVGSDSAQAAQISKICIHTHDGSTPPGYRPALPFEGGCRYCVFSPAGDVATDLSEFQQWLNCQFYQLWECQAKILLRYIWHTLTSILTLLGFFRLWLSATLINLATWGNGNLLVFIRWLDGQINNAVQNLVWAILNWHDTSGGGGTNLWDFLIALIGGIFGLLNVFVQMVANIMQMIIAGVIGFLVNAVGLLLGLLQSIINGLNTAPASISTDWIPNCNDATSGLFVVCTAIYGVEAGLAIGPFQYLVPIGIGLGALNLLWWGIGRIKAVFTE